MQVDGIARLLRDVARPGRAVIAATHDERLLSMADRVVELTPGRHGEADGPVTRSLEPGELLFREGDPGEHVFVVESGLIELLRSIGEGGPDEVVVRAGPGMHFGEVSPMFGVPRTATARVAAPSVVTGLGLRAFRHHVRGIREARPVAAAAPWEPLELPSSSGV